MIEKNRKNELQVAISQMLLMGSNNSSVSSLKLVMPFLSLNTTRIKLVNIKYPQAKGLSTEVWSQAGNTSVSKTSIHQTHLYQEHSQRNYYETVTNNQLKLTGQSDNKYLLQEKTQNNENIDEFANHLHTTKVTKKVEIDTNLTNLQKHIERGLKGRAYSDSGTQKKYTRQSGFIIPPQIFNQSVKTTVSNRTSLLKENLIFSETDTSAQKKYRQSTNNKVNLGVLSEELKPRKLIETLKSVENLPTIKVDSTREYREHDSRSESLGFFSSKKIEQKDAMVNQLETESDFPERKIKGSTFDRLDKIEQTIPSAVYQKLESVVEQKFDQVLKGKEKKSQNDKEFLIQSVSNELKKHLSSNKIISDDFIRLVAKKLNKSIQENRFRMGLIS